MEEPIIDCIVKIFQKYELRVLLSETKGDMICLAGIEKDKFPKEGKALFEDANIVLNEEKIPAIGILYYNLETLDLEILLHECAHAAMKAVRIYCGEDNMDFTDKTGENHEVLAEAYADITMTVLDIFHDAGFNFIPEGENK